MRDLDYYSTNKYEYPNRTEFKNKTKIELEEKLSLTPMTAAERKEAEKNIQKQVDEITREWFSTAVIPHNEEAQRLDKEFWQDCREDLGYDDWLDTDGIAKLEYKAYQDGHAYGYPDVYSKLQDLVEFLEEVKPFITR